MPYLALTARDRDAMLATVGVAEITDLYRAAPAAALLDAPLATLPLAQPEYAVERHFRSLAARNHAAGSGPFFIGGGVYRHHVPAAVDALIQRGEFLTAYTPYQPEVAQGTLQAMFEFQTQVALLTGMDVANASLYDGSTACTEAILMALRVTKRRRAVLSGGLHPHYREVAATYARTLDFTLDAVPPAPAGGEDLAATLDAETACVVVQYPDFFGGAHDYTALASACHAAGALLVVVVTEIMALGALEPPGAWGADIVCGEGQSLGNGLNFGGPHVGLFACRDQFLRQLPGRVCGETVDTDGQRGFVFTLSAREQHIRREKATSNICTNAGLCALAFTIHCALLGEAGLKTLAQINHATAVQLAEQFEALPGVTVITPAFFNEFTIRLPVPAAGVVDALQHQGILAGLPVSRFYPGQCPDLLVLAVTELTTADDCERLVAAVWQAIG
jgi:glycine dehydrogenase subunit 1